MFKDEKCNIVTIVVIVQRVININAGVSFHGFEM